MPAGRHPGPVALRSEPLFRLFSFYLRFRLARAFHAVRHSGTLPDLPRDRPVIIYGNHPSWWDPALYMVLADGLFRGRPGFGPMDRESLARYGFFRKLGVFGIDRHSVAGARRFLEVAREVLEDCRGPRGRAMIWVTAEGDFTDPRRRPLALRSGIAHLARAMPEALLLPLATEYVFWNESRPELLLRFGPPLRADPSLRPAEWTQRLQEALVREMDTLAAESMSRDASRFQSVLRGSAGSDVIYDLYRRSRALLSGRRFSAAHEEEG